MERIYETYLIYNKSMIYESGPAVVAEPDCCLYLVF